ncbi:magnesium and cobalt transport protein CorA [Conyzicola sp.]|uniref:magnesium and cobalt transport protein CorA n=1 Tax=Conyzicola sp. TaxID=1969404 RepID=UPI003989C755
MPLIDDAVYIDGVRLPDVTMTDRAGRGGGRPGVSWIGLYRPTDDELDSVASAFHLHRLAVEDASHGHQRSKLERYGDTLFLVLRTARLVDESSRIEFGELDIFVGPRFVVSVRHAESPNLVAVRSRLEADPAMLARGTEAILYAILDQVVDEYAPVVARLENAVDEIEDHLFRVEAEVSKTIYALLGHVVELQRAVHPMKDMLHSLQRGFDKYHVDPELRDDLRDVLDHVLRVNERTDSFRALLENALTLHSTMVGQQQSDEMRRLTEAGLAQNDEARRLTEASLAQSESVKKISAWAAVFFGPTLIATIYGMNFETMPELQAEWGYPAAILAMLATGVGLYVMFTVKKWL